MKIYIGLFYLGEWEWNFLSCIKIFKINENVIMCFVLMKIIEMKMNIWLKVVLKRDSICYFIDIVRLLIKNNVIKFMVRGAEM